MPKYCNKCNSPIEEDGQFCTQCGSNDIRDTEQTVETTPVTNPVPTPEITPVTNPVMSVPSPGIIPVSNSAVEATPTPTEINPTPAQSVPTANLIQPVQNNFADVPDFMTSPTEVVTPPQPTPSVEVPKDFQFPDGQVNDNTPKEEEVAVSNTAISEKRRKQKNNKKVLYVFLGVGGFIFIVLLFFFVFSFGVALGSGQDGDGGPFSSGGSQSSGGSGIDYSTIFNASNSFRVGSEEYGFISIPNTWHIFKDTNDNNTLQYTDDGTWIATIYAQDTSDMSAVNWANNAYRDFQSKGIDSLNTSTTSINSYNAYVITAFYRDQNKYLTTWFFESDEGKTHYLALEGPTTTGDNYNIIYSFKEDQ